MGVLQFISWIFTVIMIFLSVIGVMSMKYDYQKLSEEYEKIKKILEDKKEDF